jgi:hypothetical protein
MFTSETGRLAKDKASGRGRARLPYEIKAKLLLCIDERNVVEDLMDWI